MTFGKNKGIVPVAVLTMAVAQAVAAVDYDISPVPLAGLTNNYTSLPTVKVTSNGILYGTETGTSTSTGEDPNDKSVTLTLNTSRNAVWVTNGDKQIVIGFGLNSDGTVNESTAGSTSYVRTYTSSFNALTGALIVSKTNSTTLAAVSAGGYVIGNASRYGKYDSSKVYTNYYVNAGLGQDAWLYSPSTTDVGSTASSTKVVTPTVISLTGTLADSKGVVSTYYYTPSGETPFYSSAAVAVNDAGLVLGTSNRYTGTGFANQVGTDTWVYTPAHTDGQGQTVTASHKLLGLDISNTGNPDSYYSYTATVNGVSYLARTSTGVAINSNGWAIGYSKRYASSSSGSDRGQDGWVYNGSETYQVGIVGSYSADNTSYYSKSDGTRSSSVVAINSQNQIAGSTTAYTVGTYYLGDGVTLANPTVSSIQETWIYYAPSTGAGSTATSYTTPVAGVTPSVGSYVRVGLTDSVATGSATSMGHQASWGGFSIINYLNNAGQAAGTSTRYLTGDLAYFGLSRGADAWYYDGKGTTINITPVVTSTAGGVSYNASGVKVVGAEKSNYVSEETYTYSTSSLNRGQTVVKYAVTTTIVALNANGWVAGTNQRYNGASSAGLDSWVYDATDNVLYVLTAPKVTSAADTGNITIKALSDTGLALGYYTGADSLQYLFTWTEDDGLQTLSALNGLTNALADDTGWSSLLSSVLLADANGTLYGVGTSTVTNANGVWSITGTAAVPEPASLGMIGLGMVMLLRRGRKHA